MYVYRNIEDRSCNHCRIGKTISVTYAACVFAALRTEHAKYMRRIMLSSVACPDLKYLSTLSYKRFELK